MSEIQVVHDTEKQRFLVQSDGHTAVLEYHLRADGQTVVFPHTVVPPALGGRGIGSRLARAALDWAQAQGYKVEARCWFVAGYIERHPEYQPLLVDAPAS